MILFNLRVWAQPARNSLPVFNFNPSIPAKLHGRYRTAIKATIKPIKEQSGGGGEGWGVGGLGGPVGYQRRRKMQRLNTHTDIVACKHRKTSLAREIIIHLLRQSSAAFVALSLTVTAKYRQNMSASARLILVLLSK